MNQSQRGFHFLIGLGVLWLLWRLYAAGLILQAAYAVTGDVYGGPGAIIVAFVIEAVIAIGFVVTLLVSGIWDALYVVGSLASDSLKSAQGYLSGFQKKPIASAGGSEVSGMDAAGGTDAASSTGDPVLDAVLAVGRNVEIVQGNVQSLAGRIDKLEGEKVVPDAAA